MQQLDGYIVPRKEDKVCFAKKSLYGLKQSPPRQWYKMFDSFMVRHDYSKSQYDNCIYDKIFSDGYSFIYLLLHVDNMLITFLNKSVINDSKALLNSDFEMNDLAATKKIFVMKI